MRFHSYGAAHSETSTTETNSALNIPSDDELGNEATGMYYAPDVPE